MAQIRSSLRVTFHSSGSGACGSRSLPANLEPTEDALGYAALQNVRIGCCLQRPGHKRQPVSRVRVAATAPSSSCGRRALAAVTVQLWDAIATGPPFGDYHAEPHLAHHLHQYPRSKQSSPPSQKRGQEKKHNRAPTFQLPFPVFHPDARVSCDIRVVGVCQID